ncbi:MAG: hypothetical protein IJU54_00585 [Alphaproteobacteria bacterium]|nr:hypothetical protein [Alphaproteobacteria bacterium]
MQYYSIILICLLVSGCNVHENKNIQDNNNNKKISKNPKQVMHIQTGYKHNKEDTEMINSLIEQYNKNKSSNTHCNNYRKYLYNNKYPSLVNNSSSGMTKEMKEQYIKNKSSNTHCNNYIKYLYNNKYPSLVNNSSSGMTKEMKEQYKKEHGYYPGFEGNINQHNCEMLNDNNSHNQDDIGNNLSVNIDKKTGNVQVSYNSNRIEEYKKIVYKSDLY